MELNEYLVEWDLKSNMTSSASTFSSSNTARYSLSLGRRITGVAMTTFVPTLLICVMCHTTVYYGEGLFKAVVAVNLTSMLCLITMFNRYCCRCRCCCCCFRPNIKSREVLF